MMNKKTRGIIALVLSAILLLGVFPHSKEIGFSMRQRQHFKQLRFLTA